MPSGSASSISFPPLLRRLSLILNAKSVFFYFQAQESSGRKQDFWRYADLKNEAILDNRYLIANLIETARVVDPEIFSSIFDIQERESKTF